MKYSDLSPEAQKRARDWYRSTLEGDLDHVLEDWKEHLAEKGFTSPQIFYEGFGCQGHGASFTAYVDREFTLPADLQTRLREAEAVALVHRRFNGQPASSLEFTWELAGVKIVRDTHSRYCHPATLGASAELLLGSHIPIDLCRAMQEWAAGIEEQVLAEARDLSHQIYRDLEAEWEYQSSDQAAEDSLQCNDWEFDEDGTFLPHAPHAAAA